ncbi:hypothetical protein F5B20DRAFT_556055 [Whalleya microplaca]|nr:hypothetical protein F5B20DRAFT_556055 [Whalleya microplaca]
MVTRKPLPENLSVDTSTPPPAISIQHVRQELWTASDSEPDAERIWGNQASAPPTRGGTDQATDQAGTSSAIQDVPDPLRPGVVSKTPSYDNEGENPWHDNAVPAAVNDSDPKPEPDEVPTPLRVGPPTRSETNPFKRKPVATVSVSQDTVPPPSHPPPPAMPSNTPPPPPPTNAFSQLDINEPESSRNPWQPAPGDTRTSSTPYPASQLSDQDTGSNVWDSGVPSRVPSTGPPSNSPSILPFHAEGAEGASQPWDDVPPKPSLPSLPERAREADQFLDDQHAWDDVGSRNKGKQPASQTSQTQSVPIDDWNLIDHEPMPEPAPGALSKQSTWENFMDAEVERPAAEEMPPVLPPRAPQENPPPQPPRPRPSSTATKSETYQIKNINWYDANAAKNPRKSPILVQNANGPCPLVALVNALTLTTPADQNKSNLVETLRSREQISLDFLLEAVFDELMTHRHTNPNVSLPDMSELYAFLKGLHTGMNVNPRFIPTPERVIAYEREFLIQVDPSKHKDLIPGTFENTRAMTLYATFAIPLIHGWLPPKDDPAYGALSRQASSYDDAQSLLFHEEELEDKLSNSEAGLTEQEQQLYQDIIIIKQFLSTSATQLTPWGLNVVTKAIHPGSVAILFRNDHFSTLYRHPKTHELFTLVTDAGYFTHDEIVWESLVDVRGERAGFFSGDFRVVGGPQHQQQSANNVPGAWYNEAESSSSNANGDWQTVQSRRSRNNRQSDQNPGTPMSPRHEQEDRDLALALQLQEEEEERHRAEQAARRRESQLSEQFIEQQGRQPAANPPRGGARPRGGSVSSRGRSSPMPPARVSSASQSTTTTSSTRGGRAAPVQQVRSLIPPVSTTHRPPDENAEEAPPSYEQASKATPYVPPAGHPSHPESSPASPAPPRRRSMFNVGGGGGGGGQNNGAGAGAGPSTPVRRQGAPPTVPAGNAAASASGGGGRDKECVVM